jgi:hypothetical protein
MSLKETLQVIFDSVTDNSLKGMMDESNCYGEIETALDNHLINYTAVGCYGGEDQGSDYWCVWKFSKGDQDCFVKFYGWYASHYGTDYQGYKFVTPEKKTVIVYE